MTKSVTLLFDNQSYTNLSGREINQTDALDQWFLNFLPNYPFDEFGNYYITAKVFPKKPLNLLFLIDKEQYMDSVELTTVQLCCGHSLLHPSVLSIEKKKLEGESEIF